jgi:Na+-transporting methylmalonyl-CoA/oxaloacetate decarboxylase gamma subunit
MSSLTLCLWIYALSIVFAMAIAVVIHGLGIFVKALKLDRTEEVSEPLVPTADSEREQQALAVALAVAHHAKRQPRS